MNLTLLEILFIFVVGLIILVGWIGTILASFGVFSLFTLVIILLGMAGLMLINRKNLFGLIKPKFSRQNRYELGLGVLLIGCSFLYLRPHEYLLGGTDAGSYVNIGATIARTGKFVTQDDWTSFLSDYKSVTLRQQPAHLLPRYLQFVGWYIDDADPSRTIPQFFPFHPTLIAIGISLVGLYGGLLVTPLWGILDIAAVYFVGRRAFDERIGLLAAFLLALTPTQIYFARYPTAEPLTLLLVFTALLVYQILEDEPTASPIFGIIGGAALGAASLTRIDLPLVILLVIGALVIRWQQGPWSRSWTAYSITLSLFLIHLLLDIWFINWPYFWNTYSSVGRILTLAITTRNLVILFLFGLAMLWLATKLPTLPIQNLKSKIENRWLLIALIILLSGYAYFLRPIFEPPQYYTQWPGNSQTAVLNGLNWVRIGWYVTPLGLLLATLGLARILQTAPIRLGLFLAIGILTTIQYVYNSFIPSYHIYIMRRYVPIVMPMLMIYVAVAINTIFDSRPKGFWKPFGSNHIWLGRWAGILLTVSLTGGLIYQARFVLPQRDYAGAIAQLTELNNHLKPNAIVIIAEPSTSFLADAIGAPLHSIFGHDIATIRQSDATAIPFIEQLIATQNKPIQLIAVDTIPPVLRNNVWLAPVEMFPITLKLLMNTFNEYPSTIQTAYYGLEIYTVNKKSDTLETDTITIDIGALDAAFLGQGFYNKELLPDAPTMRWTSEQATLEIPLPREITITLEARAMIYRPSGVSPAEVTVWLDGQKIGQFVPTESWQTFSFQAIAKPNQEISSLKFKTTPFNPAKLKISHDTRDLGFLLDEVKINVR